MSHKRSGGGEETVYAPTLAKGSCDVYANVGSDGQGISAAQRMAEKMLGRERPSATLGDVLGELPEALPMGVISPLDTTLDSSVDVSRSLGSSQGRKHSPGAVRRQALLKEKMEGESLSLSSGTPSCSRHSSTTSSLGQPTSDLPNNNIKNDCRPSPAQVIRRCSEDAPHQPRTGLLGSNERKVSSYETANSSSAAGYSTTGSSHSQDRNRNAEVICPLDSPCPPPQAPLPVRAVIKSRSNSGISNSGLNVSNLSDRDGAVTPPVPMAPLFSSEKLKRSEMENLAHSGDMQGVKLKSALDEYAEKGWKDAHTPPKIAGGVGKESEHNGHQHPTGKPPPGRASAEWHGRSRSINVNVNAGVSPSCNRHGSLPGSANASPRVGQVSPTAKQAIAPRSPLFGRSENTGSVGGYDFSNYVGPDGDQPRGASGANTRPHPEPTPVTTTPVRPVSQPPHSRLTAAQASFPGSNSGRNSPNPRSRSNPHSSNENHVLQSPCHRPTEPHTPVTGSGHSNNENLLGTPTRGGIPQTRSVSRATNGATTSLTRTAQAGYLAQHKQPTLHVQEPQATATGIGNSQQRFVKNPIYATTGGAPTSISNSVTPAPFRAIPTPAPLTVNPMNTGGPAQQNCAASQFRAKANAQSALQNNISRSISAPIMKNAVLVGAHTAMQHQQQQAHLSVSVSQARPGSVLGMPMYTPSRGGAPPPPAKGQNMMKAFPSHHPPTTPSLYGSQRSATFAS